MNAKMRCRKCKVGKSENQYDINNRTGNLYKTCMECRSAPRKVNFWVMAIKEYSRMGKMSGVIRKGTEEYDEVREIMGRLKNGL